jgi:hypothetical protein
MEARKASVKPMATTKISRALISSFVCLLSGFIRTFRLFRMPGLVLLG